METEAGGEEAGEHQHGADEVGRKMQRVGFERLAAGFLGNPAKAARAHDIDEDRQDQHGVGEDRVWHGVAAQPEPGDGFDADVDGDHEQQTCFDQRGDCLDLAVTVGMALVGRLGTDLDGDIGEDRRADIEHGVQGIRQQRQAAAGQCRDELGRSQSRTRQDRVECGFFLDVGHANQCHCQRRGRFVRQ